MIILAETTEKKVKQTNIKEKGLQVRNTVSQQQSSSNDTAPNSLRY